MKKVEVLVKSECEEALEQVRKTMEDNDVGSFAFIGVSEGKEMVIPFLYEITTAQLAYIIKVLDLEFIKNMKPADLGVRCEGKPN